MKAAVVDHLRAYGLLRAKGQLRWPVVVLTATDLELGSG
jgi:hypothetical protein